MQVKATVLLRVTSVAMARFTTHKDRLGMNELSLILLREKDGFALRKKQKRQDGSL
jgi:hypothetical protein